jgi:hypothetical protein
VFSSTGTIRYSPSCKSIPEAPKWWVIVDACEGLAAYYRHWSNYDKRFGSSKLIKPAWSSHISVVRNEVPSRPEFWEAHKGYEVSFNYSHILRNNGEYWWLDVDCEQLLDFREELGLSREPYYPFHLSIGREQSND